MKKDVSLELFLPTDAKFCISIKDEEDGLRAHVTVLDCYGNQVPREMWTNPKKFTIHLDDPEYYIYVTMPEAASIARLMNLAYRWSISESLIDSEDTEDEDDEE